ncbi:16S rRNA (cytidine(1402)-2'-O)-methyltransferase [bacterium]|nr:16S rRNA (cytidine(1402)-2'-O)-methyltransferase [bacterium]
MKEQPEAGTLFVVSTPIGNLGDITFRAVEVLGQVNLIAAEDTRRTRVLLEHYGIHVPTTSYFDHNKERKIPVLLEKIQSGKNIALVSDAGTPGISDPAYRLIEACVQSDIPIDVLPGATAFVPALIFSSLPSDRFAFEGFLPRKKGRSKRIASLAEDSRTLIFYESPHRVSATLTDLYDALGDRRVVLARELTKKFQEIRRGTLKDLRSEFSKTKIKGEVVLVLEGKVK